MKLLFTGRGTSGSWRIRGCQIAAALGAEAIPNAVNEEADVAVLVKRVDDRTVRALRSRGAKLVWDVVDAWPQPHGNDWTESQAFAWLYEEINRIKPDAVIAATDRMRDEFRRLEIPVLWLRHHHRPNIRRNPIRERITVVGYEGSPSYIAKWREVIGNECSKIGASFVVNPDTLADCDVVLALRDAKGYPPRNWKSGVKLANAHASGTPWIGCVEAGYTEIATGCEYWADGPVALGASLKWLSAQSTRGQICDRFVKAAYSVEHAASDLLKFIETQFHGKVKNETRSSD
jgi:hypothetical protein